MVPLVRGGYPRRGYGPRLHALSVLDAGGPCCPFAVEVAALLSRPMVRWCVSVYAPAPVDGWTTAPWFLAPRAADPPGRSTQHEHERPAVWGRALRRRCAAHHGGRGRCRRSRGGGPGARALATAGARRSRLDRR